MDYLDACLDREQFFLKKGMYSPLGFIMKEGVITFVNY